MKRYSLPVLAALVGVILIQRIFAESPKDEHVESPHVEALAVVFATQQKTIGEVDAGNWWHDVKERQWVVKRPFYPGTIDSTHLFKVTYRIDGKDAASWFVDTWKKTAERTVAQKKK
jgi:hypothetical protein